MNIATIGTGPIVDSMMPAIQELEDIQCIAMYSRKEETARALAEKHKITTIYTGLDAMLMDPSIDVVYVASPNSLHYTHSYQALQKGKHVICEKPFTSTVQELEVLIALAKSKNLLLFEAITTIHLPNYQFIKENISKLGPIKLVQCNYSKYSSRYQQLLTGDTPNIFNPVYSGGALMDINIYNLHFVVHLFGKPALVTYMANKHSNGIDTSGVLVLRYKDFIAELVGSKDSNSMHFAMIQGENGYLHVESSVGECRKVMLDVPDQKMEWNNQTNANQLFYEMQTFHQIYQAGDTTTCYQLLDHSLAVMQIVETARKDAGIVFSADKH
ncbi:Gfo/Idh/MocA family protein [Shimazuella kribbensis]|uniref:Gfo/Idh/MocA family protein n=1 Tax=Shimazuella kribbensis TaxID=139808 RepID=UPI00048D736A|nr:Gfo/Idh/MocA family oxidoreductase [Shimazuella kribbensis]